MFNLFKQKCPVCKMKLKKGKDYPEANGQKFCSENCKEEYAKQGAKESSSSHQGCCH